MLLCHLSTIVSPDCGIKEYLTSHANFIIIISLCLQDNTANVFLSSTKVKKHVCCLWSMDVVIIKWAWKWSQISVSKQQKLFCLNYPNYPPKCSHCPLSPACEEGMLPPASMPHYTPAVKEVLYIVYIYIFVYSSCVLLCFFLCISFVCLSVCAAIWRNKGLYMQLQ